MCPRAAAVISATDATDTPVVADAGDDQTVPELTFVVLDGSRSCNAAQGVDQGLQYAWAQASGSTVELSNAHIARPRFLAPRIVTPVDLSFSLMVSDGTHMNVADAVTVHVLATVNEPPVVIVSVIPHAGPFGSGEVVTLMRRARATPTTAISV